uniref:C3H1-type domain-containing protein n=1 Tax=Alexandrium monilatum TaxID=311494 RepID=A0A7S4VNK8_9DINO
MPPALVAFCEKTQLCKFHQRGKCTKGRNCTFAHSSEELRAPPDLRRTKLCPDVISKGRCDVSECRFAHDVDEVRRLAAPKASKDKRACEPEAIRAAKEQVAAQWSLAPTGVAPSQQSLTVSLSEIVADGEPEATLHMSALSGSVSSRSTALGDESIDSLSCLTSDDSSLPWTWEADSSVDSERASSQGDSGTGNAASDNDSTASTIRGMGNTFHKIRMCRFHAEGRCGNCHACSSAHGQTESQPLLNLTSTELCCRLLHTGVCDKEGSTSAHSEEELRSSPDGQKQLPAARRVLAGGAGAVARAAAEGRERGPLSALDWSRVCVKRTFLEWREDEELGKPHRRSRSVPCRPSRDEPQPGECTKAGMPTQTWRS